MSETLHDKVYNIGVMVDRIEKHIANTLEEITLQRDLYLQQRNQLMEAAEMVRNQTSGATAGAGSILISAKSYNFTAAAIDAIKDKELEQPSEDGE